MHQTTNAIRRTPSVLGSLRSLIPERAAEFEEARKIAEVQANRLLGLFNVTSGPVPSDLVRSMPRIRVVYDDMPVSGTSHWSGTHWIITLNKNEPPVRQRFTLMHEFKHIIDHGRAHLLYISNSRYTAVEQAERAADYFAGCVLVPKRLLKAAWSRGLQTSSELARYFDVSISAVEVRLEQTRISIDHDIYLKPLISRITRGCRRPLYERQLPTQGLCS